MKRKIVVVIFILAAFVTSASGQKYKVNAQNTALNQVLIGLRDKYNFHLSFNDNALAQYQVSVSGSFDTPEELFGALLKSIPFNYRKRGNVFLILPEEKKPGAPKAFSLSGQVLEAITHEPLPYSNVLINDQGLATDLKGSFRYISSTDSIFHIRISHLGHYILDTICVPGNNYRFILTPSSIGLKEIVVANKVVEKATQIGDAPGVMRLNHQIVQFLPGNDDNSVFNLLRLQPGVLAAGEQSNGLIIWGSYEGNSQVLFDGFTLWGLKNFNDNISAVNPLVVKDVQVLKGGYDARYGERVGGIINIAGKNGSTYKPGLNLALNNVTANGMLEVPLSKKSSILLAFRQTYYNLYNTDDVVYTGTTTAPTGGQGMEPVGGQGQNSINVNIRPDYTFHDANIRFSTRSDGGDLFYVSLLGGEDQFKYTLNQANTQLDISKSTQEDNRQLGGAIYYGKNWNKGNTSSMTIEYSSLDNNVRSDYQNRFGKGRGLASWSNSNTDNQVSQFSFKNTNRFAVSKQHTMETGFGLIADQVKLVNDTTQINLSSQKADLQRLNFYAQDHIALPGNIQLKGGFRFDLPFEQQKLFIQPRISASIPVNQSVKFNAAWGIFNQFISKSTVIDALGNYQYLWFGSDGTDVPVLKATHYVSGWSLHGKSFLASLEGYYKNIEGLTQFRTDPETGVQTHIHGKGRSYGIDLFLKKDFHGHSIWLSYSLGKAEEKFLTTEYQRAPQDQRHELKLAGIIHLKPFYLSANYIYGSGFPLYTDPTDPGSYTEPDYQRTDVSVTYRFSSSKIRGELAFSILNLFNNYNIKYSSFETVPLDDTSTLKINTESVPFSPRLSVRLAL
ncbi:TonB-dependent receptor plug domain-containing protein [Prolixibacter sp. SD074]|uniref:TonB-dependent receptor plug domain-containing protein n=1 Tax=Prolixibacter sp. SD074 TaxID=2652391 RepID=UPI00126E354D|nr:TonB-dependent receptor plug domain-containing protein [Prolixibacter sp. SD074]GET28570.1 TonB-dependent receptor [Prolixibacter sp. SD074]